MPHERSFESVYPDLLKTGLGKLGMLDARRELLALFSALEHFRRDLHGQEQTTGILQVSQRYVAGLNLFRSLGFWLVNPADFSFEPALVIAGITPGADLTSSSAGKSKPNDLPGHCGKTRRSFSRRARRNQERGLLHSLSYPTRWSACSAAVPSGTGAEPGNHLQPAVAAAGLLRGRSGRLRKTAS